MNTAAAMRRYRQHRRRAIVLADRHRTLADALDRTTAPYYSADHRRLRFMHDRAGELAALAELDAERWATVAARRHTHELAHLFGQVTPDAAVELVQGVDSVGDTVDEVDHRPPSPPTLTGPRTHAPPRRGASSMPTPTTGDRSPP